MLERIRRAITLDSSLYRTVAGDPAFTNEAIAIAVVASILAAVGMLGVRGGAASFFAEVFNGILFGWIAWSALAVVIGNALGGRSTFRQMLRTLGYANAPRAIAVFGAIPFIGWLFQLAAGILAIIAGVIGIREAMGFDTGKAIITAILGVLLFVAASVVIGLILAGASLLFG
jgi:hypothetical protein